MKIAIIEPIGGHGGMNYYDFSLAGGLVNSGGDVTVYTCDKTEVVEGLSFKVKRYFKRIWGDEPRVLRGSRYFFCLLKTLYIMNSDKNIKTKHPRKSNTC